jgi:cation:H+ antiporter
LSVPTHEKNHGGSVEPAAEAARSTRRGWLPVPVAVGVALPWIAVWATGGSEDPLLTAVLSGFAILGAAILLAWAAEALQVDVSQALALGLLALIAVLPEYAVDAVFAWKAASDSAYAGYTVANMTGANRLLIGVGWSAIVLLGWLRHGLRRVELDRGNALELVVLLAATLYAFAIPLKGSLSILDTVILAGLFVFYAWASSRAPTEAPHLIGPAAEIGRLPARRRRTVVGVLLVFAAVTILVSAEPFAHGLVATGVSFGIDEFLLVQWLAPLASEAPEFIIALLFAWRAQTSAALRTVVSSKVNQWTLLIATLPLVFSLAKGGPAALPLDARQTEELFLTAAQSLFAIVLIAKLTLGRAEALMLFGLFAIQLVFPTDAVRWAVAITYIALSVAFVTSNREIRDGLIRLPALVRDLIRGWGASGA